MSNITCVILDDEPIASEIIKKFVKQISFLQLVAVAEDATEAIKILQDNAVDLLISDIEMPGIDGLQLVQSLPSPPMVIFITAHKDFAVKGFELDIIDYILKPVSFERFLTAINRARLKIAQQKPKGPYSEDQTNGIFIKMDDKMVKIQFVDILYFAAERDFIKMFLNATEFHLIHSTMKGILQKLPSHLFVRIHNSYIVPIGAIKSLTIDSVWLAGDIELPVSKSYREELLKKLIIPD